MKKRNLEFIGLPEHEIYEDGTIRSIDRIINTKSGNRVLKGKQLSTKVSGNGYPHVTFNYNQNYKGFSLHRLLALSFIDNPNNLPAVNHKDGDKLNYSLNNLEWCTHVKNIRHAYINGLTPIRKGLDSKSTKLSLEIIDKILDLVKNTEVSYKEIGKIYNVSSSCVGDLVKGKTWNTNKFSIKDLENYINSNKIQSTDELIIKLKESYEK